jgi:hypothetical protein
MTRRLRERYQNSTEPQRDSKNRRLKQHTSQFQYNSRFSESFRKKYCARQEKNRGIRSLAAATQDDLNHLNVFKTLPKFGKHDTSHKTTPPSTLICDHEPSQLQPLEAAKKTCRGLGVGVIEETVAELRANRSYTGRLALFGKNVLEFLKGLHNGIAYMDKESGSSHIPGRLPFFGHEERSIDAFPNHGTRR